MIIKFLGSGSAFVSIKENFHSNILITKTGTIVSEEGVTEVVTSNLLIDVGYHIGEALEYNNIDVTDIKHIFITHNHGDHNGGLELIGFKTFFNPNAEKPMLFANPKVMDVLWENVLKGNMGCHNKNSKVGLDDYFDVRRIRPRDGFQFLGTEFYPVRLPHIVDDEDEVPAFGLKWQEDGIKFFYSGDTQFDFWRLMSFWEYADIIFQECEFANYENGVHCQYHQLKDIPEVYKKKMWLYHYMLNGKTFDELNTEVINDGFAGVIYRGQVFDTTIIKNTLEKEKTDS
jgi:ribonuclease BN (tRNA processing enzyme)